MSRVALVTDDDALQSSLVEALGIDRYDELVRRCDAVRNLGPAAATAHLVDEGTEVLVLGPGMDVVDALCLAEEIDRSHPEITSLLVASPTAELWELAMQAGFRYVVDPSAGAAGLDSALERCLQTSDRRRTNLALDLRQAGPVIDLREPLTGRVITVLSPKGGAGKTTVSTNLATGLACRHSDSVVVVDLDLQFGDVASALQLETRATLADLRPDAPVDPAALKAMLERHDTGLFVLCAPDNPAAGEDVETSRISESLTLLAREFSH
ncbi:MAG: pilus assembly protein CpaE, partial [Actinomycetota bacterium]|nr:pilus assembly protein CpaE [Actinomycetota bacterium]